MVMCLAEGLHNAIRVIKLYIRQYRIVISNPDMDIINPIKVEKLETV